MGRRMTRQGCFVMRTCIAVVPICCVLFAVRHLLPLVMSSMLTRLCVLRAESCFCTRLHTENELKRIRHVRVRLPFLSVCVCCRGMRTTTAFARAALFSPVTAHSRTRMCIVH